MESCDNPSHVALWLSGQILSLALTTVPSQTDFLVVSIKTTVWQWFYLKPSSDYYWISLLASPELLDKWCS